ncbi:hypothetical protein GK047_24365 [Paenibacillus sp. SYP-B3998]|uniref:Polyprenyl synthetase family protein n=1 Tax=Paenibacillus sp. SYP-B3998 TaxID=2678564 RepID=A0A6G4A593_9BACL|nr:polyprenyl synthetase family protein [Paenibacillus sp. SYP-B3998]NEW09114.1 hypothetical protein [Paenibacillus sp. SYP-B3998]
MMTIIDEHVFVEDLNLLLKSFIQEKEKEESLWSEITRQTHLMLGGNSPNIDRISAATELILLSFDIIDDLQDQDNENKPWMKCPQPYTLNAILALITGFIGELELLIGKEQKEKIFSEISKLLFRSINGQQKDLNNSILTVDDYLMMVQEKSGSLFRLACYMGYSSLPCTAETIQQMNDLADCIGLIHQIQNDIKDFTRYDLKNDLFAKKMTLPILYLFSIDDSSFQGLKDYYENKITKEDLLKQKQELLTYIDDSGCKEYARVIQSICIQKANELFEQIPAISPWKERFKEITYGDFEDY